MHVVSSSAASAGVLGTSPSVKPEVGPSYDSVLLDCTFLCLIVFFILLRMPSFCIELARQPCLGLLDSFICSSCGDLTAMCRFQSLVQALALQGCMYYGCATVKNLCHNLQHTCLAFLRVMCTYTGIIVSIIGSY